MHTIAYNDMEFVVAPGSTGWDLARRLPDGGLAPVACGLFPGLGGTQALARAEELVRTVFPAGIRSVGPDVNHPLAIGDLKLVGPDVGHPNFIYWTKDSVSWPREP
jgi:hypothetical protein